MSSIDAGRSTLFRTIADKRRAEIEHLPTSCRVIATWAINGRSRIDTFSDGGRPAAPYGYALVATSTALGCCYADEFLEVPLDWVGRDVRTLTSPKIEWDVALIDALPPANALAPSQRFSIDAAPHLKAKWRADLVSNAVQSIMGRRRASGKVINLGAIGDFMEALLAKGFEVRAGDIHSDIVGQSIGGVVVDKFDDVKTLCRSGDVILLTGMSIANDTIDDVIDLANSNNCIVIIYAQTGASFAPEYINRGVACVMSETFPFYTMNGVSQIYQYELGP